MNRKDNYDTMLLMLKGQLDGESDLIANLSNASSIINMMVDNINWAGFYLMKGGELVVGPFQGKPACNRIKVGKGVCGAAVLDKKVKRIENVHEFEGHIACDAASNSEIVIPIINDNVVYGVLDIDSEEFSRFGELEEEYFVKFVDILSKQLNW